MDLITLSVVLIALLFVFLAAGVWIAVALGIIGFVAMVVAAPAPPGPIMASAVWSSSISWSVRRGK